MADPFQSVRVNLGDRSYEIRIGTDILSRAGSMLRELGQFKRTIIITDKHVAEPHASTVADSLKAAGIIVDTLVVPAGEQSKSIAQADHLWNRLLEIGADRHSLIVAVGGGVIGDLAGFVAATFARGLRFVQVPTTLLAHVDSSVGGKVGINLPNAKNMVGAFWQPALVLIDAQTLQTLPEREYRSGLAEVVKYGVIMDADFFGRLEHDAANLLRRDNATMQSVVARCCRLKANVVEADEREESGHRAILNYGHTFAHALEAVTGYDQLLHGEAVSMGMVCAARLAQRLGRVDSGFIKRQHALLTALGLPVILPPIHVEDVVAAMSRDKKSKDGQLQFILPSRLGQVELIGPVSTLR